MKRAPGPWYEASTGNHQGLIISEVTGENIAVAYDKANAPLIAAAPDLMEALKSFLRAPSIGSDGPGSSTIVVQEFNRRAALAAIAKAEG